MHDDCDEAAWILYSTSTVYSLFLSEKHCYRLSAFDSLSVRVSAVAEDCHGWTDSERCEVNS